MLILLALANLLLLSEPVNLPPAKTSLKVDVKNIRATKGSVYVALFGPGKDFPEGKPLEGKVIPVAGNSVQTTFSVDAGDYAVAIYHDENGNGKMDKNMLGIPKEPYGFSKDFRPKVSAPKFNDCKVSVGPEGKQISITLDKF